MKVVILSGYFNPLHGGHLDMIEAAAKIGDHLVVIVNNDEQQVVKKGKVILDQDNRLRLVQALRDVDEAFISVDKDATVCASLKLVRDKYPTDELVFANGGDRDGFRAVPETGVCQDMDIDMAFGVGSEEVVKRDSSTRINQALGHKR